MHRLRQIVLHFFFLRHLFGSVSCVAPPFLCVLCLPFLFIYLDTCIQPYMLCLAAYLNLTSYLTSSSLVCSLPRLTGYGIHHCFARSMMDPEAQETTMFHNFYADYYTMAGIAVASCMALCPAVGLMGRRGGLLMFMIITALASLLQLGLLNRECLSSGTSISICLLEQIMLPLLPSNIWES